MLTEDDDSGPSVRSVKSSSSKLSSLFQADEQWKSTTGNQSLAYNAKKAKAAAAAAAAPAAAPASATSPTSGSSASSSAGPQVVHASLINLIRYTASGAPEVIGSRGAAILRNSASYLLICYQPENQKAKYDAVAPLAPSLSVALSPPHFLSFTDESKQSFCLQFANGEQCELFARHIALAKSLHPSGSGQLIAQDLLPAAGSPPSQAVQSGDSVKIKYSMYLLSASHPKGVGSLVGSVGSDDKPKTLKLGAGKELQGIEAGVNGMKKGGKRFLLIPPQMAYGSQAAGSIPPNSTVLVEVELIKVKFASSGDNEDKKEDKTEETKQSLTTPAQQPQQQPQQQQQPVEADQSNSRDSLTRRVAALGGFRMPTANDTSNQQAAEPNGQTQQQSQSQSAAEPSVRSPSPSDVSSVSSSSLRVSVSSPSPQPSLASPQSAFQPVAAAPPSQSQAPFHAVSPSSTVSYSYSPSLLESKVDHLMSLFNRFLGPAGSAALLEPPIPAASVARSWTALLNEKEEEIAKREAAEKRVADMEAKMEAMANKVENAREEASKKEARQFELTMEEMKHKNLTIAELRENVKKAEKEKEEAIAKAESLRNELETVKRQLETKQRELEAEKEEIIAMSKSKIDAIKAQFKQKWQEREDQINSNQSGQKTEENSSADNQSENQTENPDS